MKYDLIVIGAGPAGMMAAGTAAQHGLNVLLMEKNKRVGRKLMITGKGRCNITNLCSADECIASVPTNGRFLYSAFNGFEPTDTVEFFEKLGLETKKERGNRVFPASDKAVDVVDALKKFVTDNKVKIKQADIKSLIIEDNEIQGVADDEGNEYFAKAVLIACGGMSYPLTGSNGDGYKLARQAGHTIIEPVPSLIPLVSNDGFFDELQGLALKNVAISVENTAKKKIIYKDFGEMLFTHFGLSGPIILSASAHMKNVQEGIYKVLIDLKPALTPEKLDLRIQRDLLKQQNKDISNSLFELLPKSIIPVILRLSGIDGATKCNSITKKQRMELGKCIKAMPVNITGFRPIAEAIVTSGGVSTKEIVPKSMESKLCKGLYFAGEVIDVDAYTGGFNLQIAFSTGRLAALNIYENQGG